MNSDAYSEAQHGMTQIKAAIHRLLAESETSGLRNADIGRALGIYHGHEGHEGHISRTLLAILEAEGVVVQDKEAKTWSLRS